MGLAGARQPEEGSRSESRRDRTPRRQRSRKQQLLLASDAEKFFTEPHYNGFPAILVRLGAIGVDELEELITDAWRCQAPRALVQAFDDRRRD